jgi:hypothetical protein
MKNRRIVVKAVAFLAFSTVLTAAQMQWPAGSRTKAESSATPKTLIGIVSDSVCGAQHMEKDKTPAECTRVCVKQSMKYALVVDKKVYIVVVLLLEVIHDDHLAKPRA